MYINLYFLLSLQTSVSLNRLQKFLNNKELDEDAVIKKEDCSKYMFFTCHVQCTPVNHYLLLIWTLFVWLNAKKQWECKVFMTFFIVFWLWFLLDLPSPSVLSRLYSTTWQRVLKKTYVWHKGAKLMQENVLERPCHMSFTEAQLEYWYRFLSVWKYFTLN